MKENLRSLVFELDCATTSVERHVETLNDLEVKLGQLMVSMDGAVHNKEERTYYREHHREVRLLSNLMHYVMKELAKDSANAHELQQSIFHAVIPRKEDSCALCGKDSGVVLTVYVNTHICNECGQKVVNASRGDKIGANHETEPCIPTGSEGRAE